MGPKAIIKKIIRGWIKELRQYAVEFYSSTSFWVRLSILVGYFSLMIAFLVLKFLYNLPTIVTLLMWFSGLIYVLLTGHYLTAAQRVFLTAIWLGFFGLLVRKTMFVLIAMYFYIRFNWPWDSSPPVSLNKDAGEADQGKTA
jgi:hypothetical protein